MKIRYDTLLLVYYSGTGNSRRVCEWIAETASENGIHTEVTSFDRFDPDQVSGLPGRKLIGFFSATHGFNMPHSMLKFLFRFNTWKGSDIFIGNTRAGMKLSKIFLPGLSGIALYFPALIMALKGYRVRSLYPVDLPSNWISLHPGLKTKVIDSMFDHYRTLTRNYALKVISGKRPFWKAFVLLPLDLLVTPLALGYYFFGRFIIAKTFFANENCDNCGVCTSQCPTRSIVISGNRPFWKLSCESCMRCMNNCPKRAIETAHSFFIVMIILLTYLVNPVVAKGVKESVTYIFHGLPAGYELIHSIVSWSAAVLIFALSYRLMHYLSRFRFFNRMITHTSLTYWKFWRRYRAPKKTEL
jgi:Pyruvate/2-oxoacid:ferredoxin oxidoreductase delta subunit